jgi:UDP-N-acetylmuramyl pentapeptide synthase
MFKAKAFKWTCPWILPMSSVCTWLMTEPTLEAKARVGEALSGQADLTFTRVHTDTRTLQAGDLFVALKGDNFDANDFLADAKAKGAKAAVCTRNLDVCLGGALRSVIQVRR